MSGKDCFKILEKIFEPKKREKIEDIKGYTIKYGNIVENGIVVDEVLVSYFKEPKSYTTENMCEINSHGGNIIVKKILELCLKNGAQLAEPGEFTKRAFINGRIDLSQAESVIDVINAKSDKELKAGINQLKGGLSREIAEISKVAPDRAALIGKFSYLTGSGNASVMKEVQEADKRWLCMLFGEPYEAKCQGKGFGSAVHVYNEDGEEILTYTGGVGWQAKETKAETKVNSALKTTYYEAYSAERKALKSKESDNIAAGADNTFDARA